MQCAVPYHDDRTETAPTEAEIAGPTAFEAVVCEAGFRTADGVVVVRPTVGLEG